MIGAWMINTLKRFQSPPMKPLGDKRAIEDVFNSPRSPLRNPNDIQFRDGMVPNVPGAPVTMGLMQVVYDDQACYDRSSCTEGPVRRFFRRSINDQSQTRQP